MATYYDILGCKKTASYEEIKKCYHEQVKKYHPDKSSEEFKQKFLLLDKAWKTLRSEDTKREYDLIIAKNELDEMPLHCSVRLGEMCLDPERNAYSYACRCGGVYTFNKSDAKECESVRVPCTDCSFHIVIVLGE